MNPGLWRTAPTRFLMSCAAIAAVIAVISAPVNAWALTSAAALPFVYAAISGVWLLGSMIALDLLRTPGASLITQAIIGVLMIPFTGGPMIVVTYLMIGALFELPYLVSLYRFWHPAILFAAAAVFELWYGLTAAPFYSIPEMGTGMLILFFALLVVGALIAVAVSLQITKALRQRGLAGGALASAKRAKGAESTEAATASVTTSGDAKEAGA